MSLLHISLAYFLLYRHNILRHQNRPNRPQWSWDLIPYFDFVQKFTQKSVEVYEQAEGLFADKVNINIASLPCGGCVAQNYSLSIMKTGRLDAEYYQPKYELLCEQIKAGSYDKLGN